MENVQARDAGEKAAAPDTSAEPPAAVTLAPEDVRELNRYLELGQDWNAAPEERTAALQQLAGYLAACLRYPRQQA